MVPPVVGLFVSPIATVVSGAHCAAAAASSCAPARTAPRLSADAVISRSPRRLVTRVIGPSVRLAKSFPAITTATVSRYIWRGCVRRQPDAGARDGDHGSVE